MLQMKISEQGLALIRRFEGFSAQAYRCPAGVMTIGYGHTISAGEHFPAAGLSVDEAEILLKKDVEATEQAICRLVDAALNQQQFDALVSFVFNIGIGAFRRSTLLRWLNKGEKLAAAAQFERWVFAGNKKLPGLVTRRNAERELFLG
jgi:lysozyme